MKLICWKFVCPPCVLVGQPYPSILRSTATNQPSLRLDEYSLLETAAVKDRKNRQGSRVWCASPAIDAAGCRRSMTAKCTKQGEAWQLVFDDSNACLAQARHPAFDDGNCKEDGVQRLGIWDCFSFQSLVSGGEQGRRE